MNEVNLFMKLVCSTIAYLILWTTIVGLAIFLVCLFPLWYLAEKHGRISNS